jgi:hypothetical protein
MLSSEFTVWDMGLIPSRTVPKFVFLRDGAKNIEGASNIKTIMRIVIMLFLEDFNLAEIPIEINEIPVTNNVPYTPVYRIAAHAKVVPLATTIK